MTSAVAGARRRGLVLRESFIQGDPRRPVDPALLEAERLHLSAVTGYEILHLHCDRLAVEDPVLWHARFPDEVGALQPDFILYEPSLLLHLIHRNVRPEFLVMARLLHGTRLVLAFGDLGSAFHVAYAGGYVAIADVAVCSDGNAARLAKAVPGKAVLDLWPAVDARIFQDRGAARDLDVCFLEGEPASPDRAALLGAVEGIGVSVAAERASGDDRVALLNRARIAVNVSRSAQGFHQLRPRALESILCGAVLFESENELTSRHLAPYRHFVPFGDAADLAAKIRRYLGNDAARRAIAAAAKLRVATHLSEHAWWTRTLEALARAEIAGRDGALR